MPIKVEQKESGSSQPSGAGPNKHVSVKSPRTAQPPEEDVPAKTPWQLVLLNWKLWRKLLRNFARRFVRGFGSGVGLYAGVRIVFALLRNPFRGSIPSLWKGIFSKDCAQVALFCGLYPSVYHFFVELLTAVRRSTDGWTYGVSGGLAGLSVAILNESRRQTLAFFSLARATGAGLSTMVARGHIAAVPYFEVGAFCACVSLILYCTGLKPHLLDQGYYRSILKWSRDYTDSKLEYLFRTPGPRYLTCEEVGLHEGSCVKHRLLDLFHSLPGFAKLYLPIHVTPVIVFNRKVLRKKPLYVLKSLVKNLALSTAFLGILVFLAKVTICVLRVIGQQPPPLPGYIPATAGAICGLALLLERYNRRKELSLFVIPHTLSIIYIAAKRSKLWPHIHIPHGFTIIFALSMMCVMHAYEREPESLTLLINGLLRFFIGARTGLSASPR